MFPSGHIRVEPMSPASAQPSMQSPGPMSPEPPPTGPHARVGHRVRTMSQDYSYAAENPFPSHAAVTGAQLGYYMPQPHVPQQPHLQSQIHYDPQSSSFTIPSGGAGESPDPDGSLLNGSRRRSTQGAKGALMRMRHIFIHKGKPTKWVAALAAAALMAAVILIVLIKNRGGSAVSPGYQKAAPSRTPVVMAATVGRPVDGLAANPGSVQEEGEALAASAAAHRQAKAAASAADAAGAASRTPAHRTPEPTSEELSLLDKGLEEIKRLKANLKEMKARVKEQAAAAKDKVMEKVQGKEPRNKEKEKEKREANNTDEQQSGERDLQSEKAGSSDDADKDGEDASSFHRASPSDQASSDPHSGVKHRTDEKGGYFDYFVSDWSECSTTLGEGIRTRNIICQHTRTGERAPLRVCTAVEAAPKDVIPCTVDEAVDDETESAEPRSPQESWPTLAQYAPPWSWAEVDVENDSCPARLWGRDFVHGSTWLDNSDMLCGVDNNAHEHASVELIRLPDENLPQLTKAMSHTQILASQITDSFLRIKHALFHPEPTRYTSAATSHKKVDASAGADKEETFALSLDCTAVSSLRSRVHADPHAAAFMRSLHYLNPSSPPLVDPSNPQSQSIFTRAFEQMTDAEFESTTFFIHRNCQPPHSAAQCMPDLFAVFAIAHTLKIEFSTIRIVFLDSGDSDPYLPAWQRLAAPGQVFTRSLWSSLRAAPFDVEDVYLTNAVFVVPSMVEALFSLGETVFEMPLRINEHTAGKQRCAGKSAMHLAFNRLMSDVYNGFGSHAKPLADAASESASRAPPVLVVAEGGGGVALPAPSAPTSDFARHHSDHGAVVKLHHSGKRIRKVDDLRSDIGAAFPTLRVHTYPQHGAFATQLALLTYANALLAVRHSVAFNTLLFTSHPQRLHIVEAVGESEGAKGAKSPNAARSDESIAEQRLTLPTSQGLDFAAALIARETASFAMHTVSPASHAVFNARWLCDRLGCASYTELEAADTRDDHDIDAVQIDSKRVIKLLAALQPPIPGLPEPYSVDAPAGSAKSSSGSQSGSVTNASAVPLVEYVPSAAEVAAEEAAVVVKAKAKSIAKAQAKAAAAARAFREQRKPASAKGTATANANAARQHQHEGAAKQAAPIKAAAQPASTKGPMRRSRLSRRYQQKLQRSN